MLSTKGTWTICDGTYHQNGNKKGGLLKVRFFEMLKPRSRHLRGKQRPPTAVPLRNFRIVLPKGVF